MPKKFSNESAISDWQTTGPDLPLVWKTLEVVSLGTLSKLFSNFSDKDAKDLVATNFRLPQHIVLESWLECLTSLRNYIAHHARIWNRRFPQKPELLRRSRYPWIVNHPSQPFKLYPILCCITYWLNAIDASNTFVSDFKVLLVKYPNVDTAAMGFVAGWEQPLPPGDSCNSWFYINMRKMYY